MRVGDRDAGMRPLDGLDTDAVDNVYIFLADALRFDELPDAVADLGTSFRGVAHALATPQALPTIVSGRLPQKHGVTWFQHGIGEDLSTVFDLDGYDTGYSELVWPGHALRDVLGGPSDRSVETATEPFVVFEHDNGGHAPYSGMEDLSPKELYRRISSREELLKQYRRTVSDSADRFLDRLGVLEERGVLANTLVVFMSDHGQMLGEHGGFVGHGLPMTPEVVYVPMVFVHPSLPAGERGDHLLQQVDVYPTALDALGRSPESDGAVLTEPVARDRPAYTQGVMHPPARYRGTYIDPGYDARGIWTDGGGHVFVRNPRAVRAVTAVYEAIVSGYTAAYNSNRNPLSVLGTTLGHYLRDYHRYGSPSVSRDRARELVARTEVETDARSERELSEETVQQLEDLGYH
jgi:arylsulfatase A-like enzyme